MQVLHSFPKLCIQVDKKQKIRCQKTGSGSFFRMSYFAVTVTGNIPRGVLCERRSQKTRDIPREFM